MTIKVCREKFEDKMDYLSELLENFGSILWLLAPLFLVPGIICAILIQNIDPINEYKMYATYLLGTIFGILVGAFSLLLQFCSGEETIFSLLNKKLKLFEWNEDC